MKSALLLVILTVTIGEGRMKRGEGWARSLISSWTQLSCMGDPIPSLLQVPTPSLDEQPVIMDGLDGHLYEPDELSLLYMPSIDPLDGWWDQDNAAWIKTEALALPSGIRHILDKRELRGAYWIRGHVREPWVALADDSESARKRHPPFSWVKDLPVPPDIRTSLSDRLMLYPPLPARSPFAMPLYIFPWYLLKSTPSP
ncbi:hypothetical protein [Prosthecobacter sp.]|uniref:hypothetical protein n=1 Tax=Prosthecobacter sp. TaxID=1965333 RepID=UPI00378325B4